MHNSLIANDPDIVSSLNSANSNRELSGVSWGAIFAGAAGAASLSLVLFILGAGLGLTSISPWRGNGLSATTIGISTLLWMTFTQIVASVVGGYLAGRLRVKWVNVHNDEVFFRDTAHGFIAWSIATVGIAFILITVIASAVNSGVRTASTLTGSTMAAGNITATSIASSSSMSEPPGLGYSVDSLFRVDPKARPVAASSSDNAEVMRIFAADLLKGELPAADESYIAQVVAARTGSSQADAEQRVSTLFTNIVNTEANAKQKAKEAADTARKASAYISLWMVVSLLAGAFSASLAATFGGRLRDKI